MTKRVSLRSQLRASQGARGPFAHFSRLRVRNLEEYSSPFRERESPSSSRRVRVSLSSSSRAFPSPRRPGTVPPTCSPQRRPHFLLARSSPPTISVPLIMSLRIIHRDYTVSPEFFSSFYPLRLLVPSSPSFYYRPFIDPILPLLFPFLSPFS